MFENLDYEVIKKNRFYSKLLVGGIMLLVAGLVLLIGKASAFPMPVTLGIGVVSLIVTYFSYKNAPQTILKATGAREVDPKSLKEVEAQELVKNVALGAGVSIEEVPKVYILDTEQINAFATGMSLDNSIIVFTTGILNRLNRNEIEAVAGHELSHILHEDIKVMAIVAGMIGVISILLQFFVPKSDSREEGNSYLAIIAVIIASIITPIIAAIIQMAISRKREIMADAGSVQITKNPEAMKNALLKISSDHVDAEPVTNEISALFIEEPSLEKRGERKTRKAGLFDSHPSIEERIEAIDNII